MTKIKRVLVVATAIVMCSSAGLLMAQDTGTAGGGNGGTAGGGRGPGGGGQRWRNMDPAQMQQQRMDRTKSELEITDDAEWKALQPLVQKVLDAQTAMFAERVRGFMRPQGGDNAGDQGSRRGFGGGTPSPEAEGLQKAIDGKASSAEMKAALAKFVDARKAKQADLEKAQADLRKVLTLRQEAILTSRGLL